MTGPDLVAEPVAAAAYFAAVAGQLPPGASVLVYDLGAGTFDASVVRRGVTGLEVLGSAGLPDHGGLDVDAAVVAHLREAVAGRDPQELRWLDNPATPADSRARHQLWEDARAAKELLSRASLASVHVPVVEVDAPVGREVLERLARPVLDRTVATTRAVLAEAGVSPDRLAGVLLVGGSSRIPLVATLLHRELGVAPVVCEQPELLVAEGSLLVAGPAPTPTPTPPRSEAPGASPAPRPRRWRRAAMVAAALALVVLATAAAFIVARPGPAAPWGDGPGGLAGDQRPEPTDGGPATRDPAGAGAAPSAVPSAGVSGAGGSAPVTRTAVPGGTASSTVRPGSVPGASTPPVTAAPVNGEACSGEQQVSLNRISGAGTAPTIRLTVCTRVEDGVPATTAVWNRSGSAGTGWLGWSATVYWCDDGSVKKTVTSSAGDITAETWTLPIAQGSPGGPGRFYSDVRFNVRFDSDSGAIWTQSGGNFGVRLSSPCAP